MVISAEGGQISQSPKKISEVNPPGQVKPRQRTDTTPMKIQNYVESTIICLFSAPLFWLHCLNFSENGYHWETGDKTRQFCAVVAVYLSLTVVQPKVNGFTPRVSPRQLSNPCVCDGDQAEFLIVEESETGNYLDRTARHVVRRLNFSVFEDKHIANWRENQGLYTTNANNYW